MHWICPSLHLLLGLCTVYQALHHICCTQGYYSGHLTIVALDTGHPLTSPVYDVGQSAGAGQRCFYVMMSVCHGPLGHPQPSIATARRSSDTGEGEESPAAASLHSAHSAHNSTPVTALDNQQHCLGLEQKEVQR